MCRPGSGGRAEVVQEAGHGIGDRAGSPTRSDGHQGAALLLPNRLAPRALAREANSSRVLGLAVVERESTRRLAVAATSSTAASKTAAFACDGFVKPEIFRTN